MSAKKRTADRKSTAKAPLWPPPSGRTLFDNLDVCTCRHEFGVHKGRGPCGRCGCKRFVPGAAGWTDVGPAAEPFVSVRMRGEAFLVRELDTRASSLLLPIADLLERLGDRRISIAIASEVPGNVPERGPRFRVGDTVLALRDLDRGAFVVKATTIGVVRGHGHDLAREASFVVAWRDGELVTVALESELARLPQAEESKS